MYVIEGACDAADAPIAPVVTDPLKVVGRVYTPFLLANAAALAAGEATLGITAMGLPDTRRAFKYQANYLTGLRFRHTALDEAARTRIDPWLKQSQTMEMLK